MRCMTCGIRETEHTNGTLCAACDRDEWREATVNSNKRFQYAEDQLRRIHQAAGHYLAHHRLVENYPYNYVPLFSEPRDKLFQHIKGENMFLIGKYGYSHLLVPSRSGQE